MNRWIAAVLALAAFLCAESAEAGLLSSDDISLYRQAFDSAHHQDFDAAQAVAAGARDPLLGKVIQWMAYSQPNSGASFAAISGFLRANPGWPQSATLQRRAEEAITPATPDSQLRDWFDGTAPLTVDGALAYGKALLAAGLTDKAAQLARTIWVSGNFSTMQERQFLAGFAPVLRDEDQVARLDHLLWERQDAAATSQMPRVGEPYRALARARLALAGGQGNAEALVSAVPDSLKADPGLIYDLLRYRRSHDQDDQAIALLQHPSRTKVRPEIWWTERAILTRRALSQGRTALAYDLARDHGTSEGVPFAEAEWLAGWIALRYLDQRDVALRHFSHMYERVQTPQSQSRAAYWAGRACDALGQADDAGRWYAASARHVTTFYGQLAANRIAFQPPLPADPQPTAEEIDVFEHQELVRVARMLGEVQETDQLRPFLLRLTDLSRTAGQRVLAANLATLLGRADIAVAVAKRSERDGLPLIASGYPIPPLEIGAPPEPPLVLGLIRQESAFQFDVVSPVGARGLMQLMPATAAKVAKTLNVAYANQDSLSNALTANPSLNVKLGSAYLREMTDSFNGSYILSVAAYNAGPSRVRRWLHDLGDPRAPEIDPVDWIESIPFSETRGYVQRVLENTQIYRRRLGSAAAVDTLEADLRR